MQTILVIDDDESLRDTIGVMLEQEGFRAVLEADGKAGFEKALLLKPELVLVDLRLPSMSGVDICKQLRASQMKTPIIVLSALGDEVDKVLLLEIGADDYGFAPFCAAWRPTPTRSFASATPKWISSAARSRGTAKNLS